MFKISGGTDAVIVPSGMRENKEQQLCCVIEFKRTIPGNQEECPPQLVAEALSAQMVSYQNVLSIYTDLCSTHAFGVQFRMDDDGIVKVPIIYTSLDAMAHHIAQFLEKFCQPIPVRATNNRSGHDNADASGGDKTDHDNDEEGDGDNAGSGPDFKKPRLLVNTLMKRADGDISLAHEHFNDHFGDTEPLTEERVIMVKHLFQSYGFALPIWDKIRTI